MAKQSNHFGEFNPDREVWISYTERLVQYFVANGITEGDTRQAVLLSSCGAPTYQLIRNLAAPAKPTEKSFTQIVDLVREHHQPRPSVIVQKIQFSLKNAAAYRICQ